MHKASCSICSKCRLRDRDDYRDRVAKRSDDQTKLWMALGLSISIPEVPWNPIENGFIIKIQ